MTTLLVSKYLTILDSDFVFLRPSNYNSGPQKVGLSATIELPVQFIV